MDQIAPYLLIASIFACVIGLGFTLTSKSPKVRLIGFLLSSGLIALFGVFSVYFVMVLEPGNGLGWLFWSFLLFAWAAWLYRRGREALGEVREKDGQ